MGTRSIGIRPLSSQSLVIVCEGTETEQSYFEELAKRTNGINVRVVPTPSEKVDNAAKQNRLHVTRQLKKRSDNAQPLGPEYYVGLPEEDDETYEKYKAEPLRWVRAAQLFQKRKKFYEAWAVYDLDKGRDDAHPKAFDMLTDTLHVALSAYSIEEWFLLHFERNPQAFSKSECKDVNDKVVNCGHKKCLSQLNCEGTTCLGGRLRQMGYIPEYKKKLGIDYAQFTICLFHKACVNAAWTRSLSQNPPYECNPYSDVDKLVMRLFDASYNIEWPKIGIIFDIAGESYKIEVRGNGIYLVYEGQTPLIVIAKDDIYWCDDNYNLKVSACNGANVNFNHQKKEVLLLNKPSDTAILCIKKGNIERYFEIS